MRRLIVVSLVVGLSGVALGNLSAAQPNLDRWFTSRTAWDMSGRAATLKKPDFMPGTSWKTMRCGARGAPLTGVWALVKYDRKHHIGLAMASTDQCSVAVFEAPPPGVTVPDAELSAYGTSQGLHIGSSYASVLSTYGKPVAKYSRHFVAMYSSEIPDTTVGLPHRKIMLPETVTLVIDNNRVTAITVSVDEGGLF